MVFIDTKAGELLQEGRKYFAAAGLAGKSIFGEGNHVMLATWAGDWVNDALVVLLRAENRDAWNQGVAVCVNAATLDTVTDALRTIVNLKPAALDDALRAIRNVEIGKWDSALPEDIRRRADASLRLDVAGAVEAARRLLRST